MNIQLNQDTKTFAGRNGSYTGTVEKKHINVLLLGDTGEEKSIFINSIFNYLECGNFYDTERGKLTIVTPTEFTMSDNNGNVKTIHVRTTDNRSQLFGPGDVPTQFRSFVLNSGGYKIRLIDTPGMRDTGDINQDKIICENILTYISGLCELHAICYLCKPQQADAIPYISQIINNLHGNIFNNFVFVFTGIQTKNYIASQTIQMSNWVAAQSSDKSAYFKFGLNNNKFCFENESFRYLAAIQQGVQLSTEVRQKAITSWNHDQSEFFRMIDFIGKLTPHITQDINAINEAIRIIDELRKPMVDTMQLIQDNIVTLQQYTQSIDLQNSSPEELQRKHCIPSVEIVVTHLNYPITVCTAVKCCEVYKIGDRNEYHYKTQCHKPCNLQNVPREVIGTPELAYCAAMNGNPYCQVCGCHYTMHMHAYYLTKKVVVNKTNKSVPDTKLTQEEAVKITKDFIKVAEKKLTDYKNELGVMTKTNATFAHFLQRNTTSTDSYAEYINYLITREKSSGGNCNITKVTGLEDLLKQHNEQKRILADAATEHEKNGLRDPIIPQTIFKLKSEVFTLPLTGVKTKMLYTSQKAAMKKEHASTNNIPTVIVNQMAKENANKPAHVTTDSLGPDDSRKTPAEYPSQSKDNGIPSAKFPSASNDYSTTPIEYPSHSTDHGTPPVIFPEVSNDYGITPAESPSHSKDNGIPSAKFPPASNDYSTTPTEYPSHSTDHGTPPAIFPEVSNDYGITPAESPSHSKDHGIPLAKYPPDSKDYRTTPAECPVHSKNYHRPCAYCPSNFKNTRTPPATDYYCPHSSEYTCPSNFQPPYHIHLYSPNENYHRSSTGPISIIVHIHPPSSIHRPLPIGNHSPSTHYNELNNKCSCFVTSANAPPLADPHQPSTDYHKFPAPNRSPSEDLEDPSSCSTPSTEI
ncbi:uncharacterized protein LOC143199869 isoform X2 [Rhynchophorus ferrugineus]